MSLHLSDVQKYTVEKKSLRSVPRFKGIWWHQNKLEPSNPSSKGETKTYQVRYHCSSTYLVPGTRKQGCSSEVDRDRLLVSIPSWERIDRNAGPYERRGIFWYTSVLLHLKMYQWGMKVYPRQDRMQSVYISIWNLPQDWILRSVNTSNYRGYTSLKTPRDKPKWPLWTTECSSHLDFLEHVHFTPGQHNTDVA